MKRIPKSVLIGSIFGVGTYAVDAALSRGDHRFTLPLVPAFIAALASAGITYVVSRPDPGEGFNEDAMGYFTWPPSMLPKWTYIEGRNLPRVRMPDGTAGEGVI